MTDFSDALFLRRRELGLSQARLAAKVGISVTTLNRYERGWRSPSIAVASRLADVLEVPLPRLFGDSPKPPPRLEHIRTWDWDKAQWLGDDGWRLVSVVACGDTVMHYFERAAE